ncbi:hypothetical protein P7H62_05305 [Vagococcus carniphilus]|uniref:hypothetical protein n=1 Tax=Vagococcus carniphilus TaxID=218144 RepID=UPI002890CB86|nr:hypothetical protein [Vagococcus carniphilus]MDT2830697.1 hypothetical protein [Vagococcus carniphilus]MDT2839531.1 hypothetical protein [Vagococcus carniphilus]MDT2853860.1 hypothetical protein [Vagococcus carniphilus]
MKKGQARGYLLEIMLEKLLKVNGYNVITQPDNCDIFIKGNGLNLRGRGGFHQFDSLGTLRITPPFMYPLRIFLEAKFYSDGSNVGIDVVRKGVGILQDVNTNYSTVLMNDNELSLPRYNYNYTVFSASGFSKGAQLYAIAHKIYLVDLDNEFLIIKRGITGLVDWLFNELGTDEDIEKSEFNNFSNHFREWLYNTDIDFNQSYFGKGGNEYRYNLNLIETEMSEKSLYLASTNSPQLIPLVPDDDSQFKESLRISPHQRVQITWNQENENWIVTGSDTNISFRLTFKLPDMFAEYIFTENNNIQERAYDVKESMLSKLTFIAYLDEINPTICTLSFDKESTEQLVRELNN